MNLRKALPNIRMGIQLASILLIASGIFYGFSLTKGLLLVVAIVMGPVFCGWLCPFGMIQDIMARVGRALKIKRRRIPKSVHQLIRPLRYVLLGLVALTTLDFVFTLLQYDPRSNFETFISGSAIALMAWSVIGVFALLSLVYDRPFCNSLCIEGAKYGAVSLARPFTVIRNREACVSCGKCDAVCPMQIEISTHTHVRSPQCINCMSCVAACPKAEALTFGITPLKTLREAFIMGGIVLCLIGGTAYGLLASDTETAVITGTSSVVGGAATGVADGVYSGTGTGYRGEMVVDVTVTDEQITSIEIVSTSDDTKWLNQAYASVASDIISEQTAEVDTVTGATYSSMGIEQAVADALVDAGSTVAETITNDLATTRSSSQGHGNGHGKSF